MGNCCNGTLNQVFCNAFNKYYNTLYTNGEISREESNNLLIIDYIRLCLSDERYNDYYNILLRALRCIADRSCLLDSSWLYNRGRVSAVANDFVTVIEKSSMEFDSTPTAGSRNPVTSDGIKKAIDDSKTLYVTLTGNLNNITSDTTITEIYTAYNSGRDIIVTYNDSILHPMTILENMCIFFYVYADTIFMAAGVKNNNVEEWHLEDLLVQQYLTFDDTPRKNSSNPVKSSGIYNMCTTPITSVIPDNLAPNKMYDFGTITSSSLTVPNLSSTGLISDAVNFYSLYFTVGTGITSLSITLPSGVDADSTPTIAAGDYVEILIFNNKASIKVWSSGS